MPTVAKKPGHNKIQDAQPPGCKLCRTCGKSKKFAEFYKSPTGKFGLQPKCKSCHAAYSSKLHKEAYVPRERKPRVDKLDPEEKKRRHKLNSERDYQRHKDEYAARKKQKLASLSPEELTERKKNQHHWNKIKKYQERGATGKHTLKQWEELKRKCGYKCQHCGRSESVVALTRDHIVPIARGGSNDISNIQPLCKTCNSKKNKKLESELSYR